MDKKQPKAPGSNWAQLQKKLAAAPKSSDNDKKKRSSSSAKTSKPWKKNGPSRGVAQYTGRVEVQAEATTPGGVSNTQAKKQAMRELMRAPPSKVKEEAVLLPLPSENPLLVELRQMVIGENQSFLKEANKAPGSYIAIDCEMVGAGPKGSTSVLARVSIVNYHGFILLDTFVQPVEPITDFRTWISGIRPDDLRGAPSFEEVQKKVAALMEDRIVVGHAIDNDLKPLMLTHPGPLVRDTQKFKLIRENAKTKMPGLKKLAETELGIQIQKSAHSSVVDARATMAIYRLYKKEWEQSVRHATEAYRAHSTKNAASATASSSGKHKRAAEDDGEAGSGDEASTSTEAAEAGRKKQKQKQQFPGGGRKGISSGLGVIVRRNGVRVDETGRGDGSTGRRGRQGQEVAAGGIGGGGGGGDWWAQL
ncbi:hypothetical protein IAT38_007745 [Cryptococcus sp. DSM 104549]